VGPRPGPPDAPGCVCSAINPFSPEFFGRAELAATLPWGARFASPQSGRSGILPIPVGTNLAGRGKHEENSQQGSPEGAELHGELPRRFMPALNPAAAEPIPRPGFQLHRGAAAGRQGPGKHGRHQLALVHPGHNLEQADAERPRAPGGVWR
jgi:hypothetical protein